MLNERKWESQREQECDKMDFNYRLKRAGPRNLNILTSNHIVGKNIPEFNYASLGMRDIHEINLSKIMALDIQETASRSKKL